jgi:predicted nuclease of predicted toxin-antitoxin system
VKFLVDECLHTSLREVAHAEGYLADHVVFLGLGGWRDRDLLRFVIAHDFTFVTNNRNDFVTLYRKTNIHAGLVVIVPNVVPLRQRQLFAAVLKHVSHREMVNAVIEADFDGDDIRCVEYSFPRA